MSQLALGTGRLGTDSGGGTDAAEARRVLEGFADAGGTFIDTSSAYQGGRAEEMTGAFLANAGRDRFVVASKYGRTPNPDPAAAAMGMHRGAMRAELEGSLKRLGTDRIDVYFPHFDDGLTPIEEVMRGLEDLVRAGKVVHVGLSNFPAWRAAAGGVLADLRGWAPLAVLQLPYSLTARDADRELLPLAHALGLGVMGYSPLAGGALTAKARRRATDQDASSDRAQAEPDPETAVVDAVLAVAAELRCAPASVALSWVCATGVIPVLGPRTLGQLRSGLTDVRPLSEDQIHRLEAASRPSLGYPHDLLSQVWAQSGLTDARVGTVL